MIGKEMSPANFYLEGLAGLRSEARPQVTRAVDSFLSATREGRIRIFSSVTAPTSRVAHWEKNTATVFLPSDYTPEQLKHEAPRILVDALSAVREPSSSELQYWSLQKKELARELLDAEPPIALK